MKNFIAIFILIVIFLLQTQTALAEYILPYPSYLSGNKLYKVSEFVDSIKKYWYFGTLTQLKYIQEMSDKHLVEAKTLFEYKQYALGVRALEKSNTDASEIPTILLRLNTEQKSNQAIVQKVNEEMEAHKEVLKRMFLEVPESVNWSEEKKTPFLIDFSKLYLVALGVREKVMTK